MPTLSRVAARFPPGLTTLTHHRQDADATTDGSSYPCAILHRAVTAEEWNHCLEEFNETFSWPPETVGELREMMEWYSTRLANDPKQWMMDHAHRARVAATEAIQRRDRIQRDSEIAEELAPINKGVTEKVNRYETSIHRAFLRDMHELQRLQAMRLGEKAALPLAVDVTGDGDT